MSECASRGFDARDFIGVGMASQDSVGGAESVKFFAREKSLVGQERVERQAAMSLAQNAAIAVDPPGPGGIVAENVVVQDAQDLDERIGRADVPASGSL
jgi:hypothetical protein